MPGPNFVVAGTVKAGTTSLYNYLKQHPEVYMSPIKEPHHFATDMQVANFGPVYSSMVKTDISSELSGNLSDIRMNAAIVQDLRDYQQLYRDVKNEKAIGEASTSYMYSATAAREIFNYNPKAKVIMSLRNPLQRAYSHYLMNYKSGYVKGSFQEELLNDIQREPKGWGISRLYMEHGFYASQIQRYFDVFPKEQILILLFDEIKKDPDEVMRRVYNFLGVDSSFQPATNVVHNKTVIPRGPFARFILSQQKVISAFGQIIPKKVRQTVYESLFTSTGLPPFLPSTRELLTDYYKSDIQETGKLIGRDLSAWLEPRG